MKEMQRQPYLFLRLSSENGFDGRLVLDLPRGSNEAEDAFSELLLVLDESFVSSDELVSLLLAPWGLGRWDEP